MNDIEMKQGLVYQSDRTGQLRYADKDGKEQWIQQVSRYKALEPIKRGQAVSIATKKDFEIRQAWDELTSTDTYIVLTDTRIHNRCIGLAYEPAEVGQEIHIAPFGTFEFNKDYELLHDGLEYNPEFTFGDVGKTVYIAYPGPKYEGDSDLGPGFLTTDKDKVYKYYHNIIQIGHVTDAPVKNTDQKITTIEISIQGDDRGLLEATWHEGVMAEDVEFNPLNPIRVFAFGQDKAEKFIYTFKYSPLNDKDHVFTKDDFIFVHKLGGEGAFVSFTDDFDINNVNGDEDYAELHYPFIFNKNRPVFKAKLEGDDMSNTDSLDKNIESLAKAFQKAYKATTGVDTDIQCTNTSLVETHIQESSDVDYRIDERIATIKSDSYADFVDVYISQSLRERLSESKVVQHGSLDNRGKIVLADIRIPSRRNIFGIYYGNEPKLLKGHTYAFIRQGEIVIPKSNEKEFKLGTDYYLDRLGMLDERPLLKHGVVAKIGTMKQDRRMVIHDTGTQRMYRGDFPVAYQKPCAAELDENGNLHYISSFGYVACDGEQKLKISEYEVLYKKLLGWYPRNEIDCDDGIYFNIPRIVRETAFDYVDKDGNVVQKMVEVPVEMKCEPDSIFEELNHTVYLRDFQRFEKETVDNPARAAIQPFEISAIADYGFKDEEFIGLENFDIHLYVDTDRNYQGGPHNWQEVSEGFYSFNEANTYGYKWKLEYVQPDAVIAPYGKWILTTDIGEGHGIAVVNGDNSCPLKVTDCYYKLYVARKEKAPRQFDIENIYKRYQTNTVYSDAEETKPFLNKATTGKAVQLAIRNQHDVDSIIVNEGAVLQFGNKEVLVKKIEIGAEGDVLIYGENDVVFETSISKLTVNEVRKFIDDFNKEHHHTRTIDGNAWEKDYSKAEDDKGRIHGMITGQGGNLNASALEHIQVATLSNVPVKESENEDDYEEHKADSFKSSWILKEEKGYIPLRSPDVDGVMTESHEGKEKYFKDGQLVSTETFDKDEDVITQTRTINTSDAETSDNRKFIDKVSTPGGTKTLELRYNFDLADEDNQDKETEGECTDIDFVKTVNGKESFARIKIGSYTIASLSKLKRIYGEKLPNTEFTTPLAANSVKYDEDSNYFKNVLGSALQAAYEMPIAYWQYNNEEEWYHKTLSVVVERIKDVIENTDSSVRRNVFDEEYNYTDAEKLSIREYLKSTLDTAEKGVNQTSQVGLLLEAAKETQERLLKLESSTFGADAETIPGNLKPFIESGVEGVNSDPTTLGLNRLVRAICLELYHDVDPDNPTGADFVEKPRQPFSPTTERKSSLSRIDALDRVIHGRVEGIEDGSKVAANYLKSINSSTYPYHIEDLPSRDKDRNGDELNVVSRETIFGRKELATNKDNFNGTVDALYRITEKLNALTKCVVGTDNIVDGPVELNKIRDRVSELETYDEKPLLEFDWEDNSDRMTSIVPLGEDD